MILQEIAVLRFKAATDEDKPHYEALYQYFHGRNRCGVFGRTGVGKSVKDMYLLPLSSSSNVPSQLMPFTGPGKKKNIINFDL